MISRRLLPIVLLVVTACSGGSEDVSTTAAPDGGEAVSTSQAPAGTSASLGDGCADVVGATITDDGGTFTVAASVSSADTGWDKYADAWQVRDGDGNVLGERVLTHPHENEQPFTRSQGGITIPEGLKEVTIAARDSVAGFCGEVFTLEVPGR
jgi:hypothetical protein